MPRLLSTLCTASLVTVTVFFTGCSTIYRPVFSPNKTRYRPPPEAHKKSDAELLPPETTTDPNKLLPPVTNPAPSLPTTPSEPAPAPGMLDSAPTIPGLPPP